MWNDHRSVALSRFCTVLFMGLLLALACTAPWLVRWLVGFSRAELAGTETYFLVTIYTATVPAAVLLCSLFLLLQRIAAGEVFLPANVEHLRRISWSCFLGGAICLTSTYYYIPWLLVAVAAAFMGLIVRVVKNVVAQAVALQQEADYTI